MVYCVYEYVCERDGVSVRVIIRNPDIIFAFPITYAQKMSNIHSSIHMHMYMTARAHTQLYDKHGIARAGNYYLTEADVCYPEYENVHHDWDWEKNEHPNYGFESKEKILPC